MSNQSFDIYLTLTGKSVMNKMLAGETLSLTRAVISSFASNNPENLSELTPELLETTQIALTDRGTYCEIELSFNFRNLESNITFASVGIYGQTESSNETLIYVALVNSDSLMTIHAHSPITYVLSLKESLTQGTLTVNTNSSYATPISHNSDFTRHIFTQINTSTDVALVNSGLENNFANGDTIVFVPKVNINAGKKIRIASIDYILRYKDFNNNNVSKPFLAHKPYGLAYNNGEFIYKEYNENNIEVVSGIAHYWTGTEWKSTMQAGMINAFANTSAPVGYLLCNGKPKNKNDYPELFAVIGYKYGGSGNQFNLPNLQGRFILGVNDDHALGSTGGAEKRFITISNLPVHNHDYEGGPSGTYKDKRIRKVGEGNTNFVYAELAGGGTGAGVLTMGALDDTIEDSKSITYKNISTKGNGQAFNVMSPYIAINYYISTGKSLI